MSIPSFDVTQFLRRWHSHPRKPEPGQLRFDFMEGSHEVQQLKRCVGRVPVRQLEKEGLVARGRTRVRLAKQKEPR